MECKIDTEKKTDHFSNETITIINIHKKNNGTRDVFTKTDLKFFQDIFDVG